MIVTINTDASFSNSHQKGSFAFWIVCNEFKILKSGLLRKKCARPEVAEFKCIINALHTLYKNDCSRVTKIIVNTDCLNVIHLVKRDKDAIRRYRLKTWGEPLVQVYKELRRSNNKTHIPIEFRHVKSHTGVGDARSYVNEWCDREAKKALMEMVNEIERSFNYLLADDGGVSNWETQKFIRIGSKFEHEYGTYIVKEYLDDDGNPVQKRKEATQVYCERISK